MTNWAEYVKASYELVMEAQHRACTMLDYDVGAFVVHTVAKHMSAPINTHEAVAIKLLQAVNAPRALRKSALTVVCEQCVLIDGLQLNRSRWASSDYYKNMGVIAAEQCAYTERPPDELYIRVAQQFAAISQTIQHLRVIQ